METYNVAIVLSLLLRVAYAQGISLSAGAWAAIGLIGGVVVIIVGLIWIVFCILVCKHQREHQSQDQSKVKEKERIHKQKKEKQNQKQEQKERQRELELSPSAGSPVSRNQIVTGKTLTQQTMTSPQSLTSVPTIQVQRVFDGANTIESSNTSAGLSPSSVMSHDQSVPLTSRPIFVPPATAREGEGRGGRSLQQLSRVSSSRLRKLSDVEECDVQPEDSSFPPRYGQRRPSVDTSRRLSYDGSSEPFSFNFESSPMAMGRSHSQNKELLHVGAAKTAKNSRNTNDHQDRVFGQLSSWPEFN